MSETLQPSYRYTAAAYWWIATEIARRHPKLELTETYIQDGFYDMITLRGMSSHKEIHVDFNRPGSIHVHPDHIGLMTAGDVIGREDAHWAVKRIEDVAGLVPSTKAPVNSARIVTLRLMAQFLNYVVNDRHAWDLRMITAEGDGPSLALLPPDLGPTWVSPFPELFPTMKDFHSFMVSSDLPSSIHPGRLWGLLKDGAVVAIFDTTGVVHTGEARVALRALYSRSNRNLSQTMATALGSLLP